MIYISNKIYDKLGNWLPGWWVLDCEILNVQSFTMSNFSTLCIRLWACLWSSCWWYHLFSIIYQQTSNISWSKSQNLFLVSSFSCLCPVHRTQVIKSRLKVQLEQRRQAMLQLHLSDQQFYCLLRCALYYRCAGIDNIVLLSVTTGGTFY